MTTSWQLATTSQPHVRHRVVPLTHVLAQEESRGPEERAREGSEFTSYSSADMDVKLLLALIKSKDGIAQQVCVPNYFLTFHRDRPRTVAFARARDHTKVSIRAGIMILDLDTPTPELHLPPHIDEIIQRCRTRNKRFLFFNTGIYAKDRVAHANAILLDLQHRTIERYDPAGDRGRDAKSLFLARFPGWKWIGPRQMPTPVQTGLSDSFAGMCVTFSLYYTLLRVSNPDESAVEVYRWILARHRAGELRSDILKLNKYASKTLNRLRRDELDEVRSAHRLRQQRRSSRRKS
jgi:hypothetical protein